MVEEREGLKVIRGEDIRMAPIPREDFKAEAIKPQEIHTAGFLHVDGTINTAKIAPIVTREPAILLRNGRLFQLETTYDGGWRSKTEYIDVTDAVRAALGVAS